ncbi:muts domain V [Pseudomassariella vexata]|uniref:Muts domain V n=1 Tax=Pseudomassariella vexata TaxID=1141098 RepID=A0A1Y2DM03_9PEZI|nr:muts domain V [Pseudomassariella vexata]ORY60184.1 muts domain V [Pseudomassariella vexata]
MCGSSCRRLASRLVNHDQRHLVGLRGILQPRSSKTSASGLANTNHNHNHGRHQTFHSSRPQNAAAKSSIPEVKTRVRKKKTSLKLEDLPQGLVQADGPPVLEPLDEGPAYPTVVLQAHRNMQRFENCVLLTRVGGFYELYFSHAEEYGPLLNLKVAQKKTTAGPVPMAGFPFFQLDRFLKTLVQEFNCYVAIAEEFPNDAGDKVSSNGLMHDRKVTRVITPGTLIDENFMDPYANNYIMAIHLAQPIEVEGEVVDEPGIAAAASDQASPTGASIGLAWLDISTGQFYTQSTTIASLSSILSRIGPREIVIDATLQSQPDHMLFSILTEDKNLITYTPHTETLPTAEWTSMLETEIPAHTVSSFTPNEVQAGSLLLQYVRERLLGLSMKLQPPIRHESMQVLTIDKNSMRSLEIKQTMRDGAFRGSLLHAIRRTVTKSGARLLNEWVSAPSTSLATISQRQDLVEYFIKHPDLRDEVVQLLRRSHDSQRLVQKFAFGRGDPDDLVGLANTVRATEDIVQLLATASSESGKSPFTYLLARINLDSPSTLADKIRNAIDEDGISAKHELEVSETATLLSLATEIVSAEGNSEDAALLPKSPKLTKKASSKPTSIRDHYADDNLTFMMRASASPGLQSLHAELNSLLEEKETLCSDLSTRLGVASLTLRWTPTLGHICHVKGTKDVRKMNEVAPSTFQAVSSSRSTRAFHVPEWTHLGQRIHQTRFQMQSEETRILSDLRGLVVLNLVKLRRNATALDELDISTSFARLASEQALVRPSMNDTVSHIIVGGRHPTVESGLRESQGRTFTANDCLVGTAGEGRLWLITGPNMAGKSTYLRQNALITILAQTGCYVPAHFASLGVVDAIFSRVGSADNLYRDQSTFMVEMLETAQILRSATPRSFVVMDEIGRGTTPEDGVAVAFASLFHLVMVNKCRALFATHFHRLAELVEKRGMHIADGGYVETYCTDVEEDGTGSFVYIHKLRKGVNRQSHALKVARLAGLPEAAITMAREILGQGVDAKLDHKGETNTGSIAEAAR